MFKFLTSVDDEFKHAELIIRLLQAHKPVMRAYQKIQELAQSGHAVTVEEKRAEWTNEIVELGGEGLRAKPGSPVDNLLDTIRLKEKLAKKGAEDPYIWEVTRLEHELCEAWGLALPFDLTLSFKELKAKALEEAESVLMDRETSKKKRQAAIKSLAKRKIIQLVSPYFELPKYSEKPISLLKKAQDKWWAYHKQHDSAAFSMGWRPAWLEVFVCPGVSWKGKILPAVDTILKTELKPPNPRKSLRRVSPVVVDRKTLDCPYVKVFINRNAQKGKIKEELELIVSDVQDSLSLDEGPSTYDRWRNGTLRALDTHILVMAAMKGQTEGEAYKAVAKQLEPMPRSTVEKHHTRIWDILYHGIALNHAPITECKTGEKMWWDEKRHSMGDYERHQAKQYLVGAGGYQTPGKGKSGDQPRAEEKGFDQQPGRQEDHYHRIGNLCIHRKTKGKFKGESVSYEKCTVIKKKCPYRPDWKAKKQCEDYSDYDSKGLFPKDERNLCMNRYRPSKCIVYAANCPHALDKIARSGCKIYYYTIMHRWYPQQPTLNPPRK